VTAEFQVLDIMMLLLSVV